ncbi:MAG: PDZ domain-containing protein [Bdellovibrio sp.]|nr:PDZ domain-containing protein [Methylotenera sp.]
MVLIIKDFVNVKNKSNYPSNSYLNNKAGANATAINLKKAKLKWMLISLLTIGTLLVATKLFAAENLFEKNYKAQNNTNLVSLQASPDTKMYVSNHKDDDNISMLENGFDMMGSSGFATGEVPADLALQHAKAIKADTVLVYTKFGAAKTAASKMAVIKEAAKKGGGVVEDKDLKEDPTQYDYYASYWAKLPAPLLGVHIIKLVLFAENEEEAAANKKVNTGLKILAVIKDSPAAKAGLKRGDTLYKIADVELNKPEELSNVVRKHQGQNVAIEFERAGIKNTANAQINTRN